ncbi:neuronatin-like [Cervus elaphus]|uniref:neuronatin-like n=1 Tax=Cervus canadensis TaxID=1574408 RepID=UPI001CA36DEC|nr:neuronatin-like [Cervus canadensis]XP_043764809.1 neuronatin-like [Cervus elaphus]
MKQVCPQTDSERPEDLEAAALALNHPPASLGTMAAASAELLIIGWYVFRELLQAFGYSLQKLAYTVSRTGRHVLGERRQRAPS